MQPRPTAETVGPERPRGRVCIRGLSMCVRRALTAFAIGERIFRVLYQRTCRTNRGEGPMTRTTTLQRRALGTPFMSNIAREVDHLQDSIRRMFDNPFTVAAEPLPFAQPIGWFPAVEIA